MLVASGCICFERPGEAHYWFALSTGVYGYLWFSFGFAVNFAVIWGSPSHLLIRVKEKTEDLSLAACLSSARS